MGETRDGGFGRIEGVRVRVVNDDGGGGEARM